MERTAKIISLTIGLLLALSGVSRAQSGEYDVFVPISKYISQGDGESLSAWFADNLDVSIGQDSNNCSKNQARQIVKSFFETNVPVPSLFPIRPEKAIRNMPSVRSRRAERPSWSPFSSTSTVPDTRSST